MSLQLLLDDLRHSLDHASSAFSQLRGARLFITGGTGFFGRWLLETFQFANRELQLGANAVVLSRDPDRFLRDLPHLADDSQIAFVRGDLVSFEFPAGEFTHVIHGATETNSDSSNPDPLTLFDAGVAGTRRVLDFTRSSGAQRFLFTSSGAIYGAQPADVTHLPEDHLLAPAPGDIACAYGHAKRAAEFLCAAYHQRYGIEPVIARGFAFVGPHLPLDSGYAIGNFIRDALRGQPIQVRGDGTPLRSYLHAADLAIWLWQLLTCARPGRAYNVGSDVALSIAELAQLVADTLSPGLPVRIAERPRPDQVPRRYIPSVERVRDELHLCIRIPLDDAIARTAAWHRKQGVT
jgi:nucleoside-diphosphate-sugar epimerase